VTLRRRLHRYLVLAALASCLLTVGVAVVLIRHRVEVQRQVALNAQADAAAAADLAPGTRVYRVGAGHPRALGPLGAARVVQSVPGSARADGTATVAGRPVQYAIRPSPFGRVILIRSGAIPFAEFRPFLTSLIIAGAGGALLAALLAVLLARRMTRPVAELARATQRLAAGQIEVSVPADGDDELAELGRSFNDMASQLARARSAQQRFLESVSHELRTPLTSIRGYAEALEEGAVAPEDGGRIVAGEARRLERLVADLLELARLGRQGFSVAAEEVDLAALALRAVERHQRVAEELGVSLRSACAEGGVVVGDEDRLLQVVSNLIENALRLTPAGGTVEVRCRPGELAVRDTGPGIAAEDLPRAFERFYLHDRYRSERAVGSGLGLAIVQELVQAMGGTVEAQPAPGGGAQFVIRLTPARSARPGALRPSA